MNKYTKMIEKRIRFLNCLELNCLKFIEQPKIEFIIFFILLMIKKKHIYIE